MPYDRLLLFVLLTTTAVAPVSAYPGESIDRGLAGILVGVVVLTLAALLVRRLLRWRRTRRLYSRWPRPRRFDRNLVVIGAGAAGLVAAYVAAAARAKVTLIESGRMGGDCLNTGCVPSKALIRTARFVHQARHAQTLGIAHADVRFEFSDIMERVRRVIRQVEPHDSEERYRSLGVDVVHGRARIASPWCVEVDGRPLTTRAIVIAAGARPFVPPLPGLEEVGYLTSDTLWELQDLPARLAVLGGGPIGCELAQAFARLGSRVTLVQRGTRLLPKEDPEVAEVVREALAADGVEVLTGHEALRCERAAGVKRLVVGAGEGERSIPFDALLCAVGRVARTEGYGLEALGIPLNRRRTIETDAWMQTLYPNIYACGDVAGPYQFTHVAAHQAWYAAANALFGHLKRFRLDDSALPWVTFTDPEVAHVGLSEQDARRHRVAYEVTRYALSDLDRAIADEATTGFIKILTPPGKDRLLGVTIVASHAGELLTEFVLAMKNGLGLNRILRTLHSYPTLAEANRNAAGAWRRNHTPQRLLHWLERYHAWRRL